MVHALGGARERLNRADENIQNLAGEIDSVLGDLPTIHFSEKPLTFTEADRNKWETLRDPVNRNIPPRFSVLVGEIAHHMRAAFDHVAWQLSSPGLRSSNPAQIEFPVFSKDPSTDKDKLRRYKRKIEGMVSVTALTQIEALQPYKAPNPSAHPLWLIHDLDRIDKHRELVLVVRILTVDIKTEVDIPGLAIVNPCEKRPRKVIPIGNFSDYMKTKSQILSAIAVDENLTGTANPESVVPLLQKLLDFSRHSIESFSGEFV